MSATISKREQILQALAVFIAQRPGLEFGNYGDVRAYRSEMRSITADRHVAERLLAQVSWRTSIGEKELREAFRAFSGRLSIVDRADGAIAMEYCTGQYFPTEYRRAACAVLASALWDYFRDQCLPDAKMPEPIEANEELYRSPNVRGGYVSAGEWLRSTFRREFGRTIAQRWFS